MNAIPHRSRWAEGNPNPSGRGQSAAVARHGQGTDGGLEPTELREHLPCGSDDDRWAEGLSSQPREQTGWPGKPLHPPPHSPSLKPTSPNEVDIDEGVLAFGKVC